MIQRDNEERMAAIRKVQRFIDEYPTDAFADAMWDDAMSGFSSRYQGETVRPIHRFATH